jgi:hypothetical protein
MALVEKATRYRIASGKAKWFEWWAVQASSRLQFIRILSSSWCYDPRLDF